MGVPTEPIHQAMYRQFYAAAIKGGCDAAQARSIAKERTCLAVMRASAQVVALRERQAGNIVRDKPL